MVVDEGIETLTAGVALSTVVGVVVCMFVHGVPFSPDYFLSFSSRFILLYFIRSRPRKTIPGCVRKYVSLLSLSIFQSSHP